MPPDAAIENQELWDILQKVCPPHPGETAKAYRAFADTAFSGMSIRQLLARYKEIAHLISESYDVSVELPPTLKIGTLFAWSKQYHWQQRLKDWRPVHEAYKRRQWSDRERAILERWNNSRSRFLDGVDEMLERAEMMLKHPYIEKKVKRKVIAQFSGQEIDQEIIIAPSKWQMRDVAAFYKVALELMVDVVGDRQVMIDRLQADGYIITDPSAGGEDANIEEFLAASERLEQMEF